LIIINIVYLHHHSFNHDTKITEWLIQVNNINTLKYTVMARNYETALAELDGLKAELAEIEAMTDEEACYKYNVDSKSDIVDEKTEEIAYLKKEVDYLTPMDFNADPAIEIFGSYEAMNSYLY